MTPAPLHLSLRALVLLAVLLGSRTPAKAQNTLVVGPGGFAQIDPAIQAARPGDTILVTVGGRLDPFTLDRGLTLRAAAGFAPNISNALLPTNRRDTEIRLPLGHSAQIVGIDFRPEIPGLGAWSHARLRVTSGTVRFLDCQIHSRSSGCGQGTPALEVHGADVSLHLCRLRGTDRFGAGLRAIDARIAMTDTWIRGGDGCWDSYAHAAHAVVLERSLLHGCRLDITGGDVPWLNPGYDAGDGIHLDAGSRLALADSRVSGGSTSTTAGGAAGDAIDNPGPVPAALRAVTLIPGTGGTPGLPVRGPSRAEPALLCSWTTPAQEPPFAGNWIVHTSTAPRAWMAVGYATRLAARGLPGVGQPLWLDGGPSGPLWITRRADGQGRLDEILPIPPIPALRGRPLFAQSAAVGTTLQLSPPVGGTIR